jgi:hypothetical protein
MKLQNATGRSWHEAATGKRLTPNVIMLIGGFRLGAKLMISIRLPLWRRIVLLAGGVVVVRGVVSWAIGIIRVP